MDRPDQENLNNLLQDIADVRHGGLWVKITTYQGWIASYVIEKVEKGSKAPLKKVDEEKVNL